MAKLFTVTDLERCARLAATRVSEGYPVEGAVSEAVRLVSDNTARVYDEFIVLEIAQRAAEVALEDLYQEEHGKPSQIPGMWESEAIDAANQAFKERTNGR